MKYILEIQNIFKKFEIFHESQSYLSLRESIYSLFKRSKVSGEEFYALKNINFNVREGESIAIIGKNGAGKSTLLKILSRITPPTSGKILSRGRIASLLEVGTGFHPELTGKENIFLNGSILGMKRKEIRDKYDAIVNFSGVEKFLDTPLKHYSSGMSLRLAFAVASFLEPEILIIDEVLAVGDAEFQQKCIKKMNEVSDSGRTLLFVSHNMAAVKSLCRRGIVLENGKITEDNNINDAVKSYLSKTGKTSSEYVVVPSKSPYGSVNKVIIENKDGLSSTLLPINEPWQIKILFTINQNIPHFIIGVGFVTLDDIPVRTTWSKPKNISEGVYEAIFRENTIIMAEGKYKLVVGLSFREQTFHFAKDCAVMEFESYADKNSILRSSGGVFLNPMDISIKKLVNE